MVTIDDTTAAHPLRQPVSAQETTMRGIIHSLSRSLAEDLGNDGVVNDDLMDHLDAILLWPPHSGRSPSGRCRPEGLLSRFGFPHLPRQRTPPAPSLSGDAAARAATRFRMATTQLIQAVPYRVAWYPTEELRLLKALPDEYPPPDQVLPYLRRYALALLAVLDLLGNDS